MHAYVAPGGPGHTLYQTSVDLSKPKQERIEAAERLFENVGGTKEQGRAWLEGLQGIPQELIDQTGNHMLNSALDRLIYRQKSGHSLDTPETLTVMKNAAKGEAAMTLKGKVDSGDISPADASKMLESMYGEDFSRFYLETQGKQPGGLSKQEIMQFLTQQIDVFNMTREAYATNR